MGHHRNISKKSYSLGRCPRAWYNSAFKYIQRCSTFSDVQGVVPIAGMIDANTVQPDPDVSLPKSPEKSARVGTQAKKTGTKSKKVQNPAVRQIVFDSNEDRFPVAEQAMADPEVLDLLIESLSGSERRLRQFSAAAVAVVAASQPALLERYIPQIADALHRPEAQTRWEILEALTRIVALNPAVMDDNMEGVEASLYDEESGTARLGAVRFLTAYGALDGERSSRVWPLIDEAIQCYHGDAEFQDMLIAIIGYANGEIAKGVRKKLADRMRFDAQRSKGPLKRRAQQIVEICEA